MRVARPERRHYRRVHDAVNVSLSYSGIARMKLVIRNLRLKHAHVFIDISINRCAQLLRRYLTLQLDASDLSFSVYARIRAPRAVNVHALSFKQRQRTLKFALNSSESFLALPSVKIRAVILQKQFVVHGLARRLPGLTAGSPNLHASQMSGSTDATLSVTNATRGTPTSAPPPDLSMIDAAAITSAPARCNASIVSRVDPPVVITSSTTSVLSPGATLNPRRSVISPASLSVQINRAPNARATSCPITIPPIAGDATS